MSNVKQIMLGILQYTQDYDETTPAYRWTQDQALLVQYWHDRDDGNATNRHFWADLVPPYLKNEQIFDCPSRNFSHLTVNGLGKHYLCYGYNGQCHRRALATFKLPAQTIVLGDVGESITGRTPTGYVENWFINTSAVTEWHQISWWFTGHNNGGNYGFLDGHVKWLGENDAALGPVYSTSGPYPTGDQTGYWGFL